MKRLRSLHDNTTTRESRRNALRTLRRGDTVGMLLLGKAEVGKTALVNRWLTGTYTEDYIPTVEDFHEKSLSYKDQSITIGLIDMSGSNDFPAMVDLYLNRVDSVMLVYEVGDQTSVDQLKHLYQRTLKVQEQRPDLFVSVIGTKVDLQDDVLVDHRHKDVVDMLTETRQDVRHILTSARHNMNVTEAFEWCLSHFAPSIIPNEDTIKRLGKLMKQNKRKCCFKFRWCCCIS